MTFLLFKYEVISVGNVMSPSLHQRHVIGRLAPSLSDMTLRHAQNNWRCHADNGINQSSSAPMKAKAKMCV